MYYLIYKITNLIDNKIYIGSHKTKNIHDGYMGSGKYLKYAIEKYGLDNFKKEILFIYDNAEDMYNKESELVNEDFLATENTYNLTVGGKGGFDYVNNDEKILQKRKEKYHLWYNAGRKKIKELYENDEKFRNKMKNIFKNNIKKATKKSIENHPNGTFWGKNHSTETKEKMRKCKIGKYKGNKNSQYGTCWIYHDLIGNKKCKKELLPEYIEQGWYKGRIIDL